MLPLLVLRPEPGAPRTADKARRLGLDPVVLPLFEAVAREWTAPDPAGFDALMLTSANAVRLGGAQLALFVSVPVYAVGAATATAARAAGFDVVAVGESDAAALVARIIADGRAQVLHLAGHDRIALGSGERITAVTVYAVDDCPVTLPEGAAVALIHSPRAARRFAALCPSRAQIDIVAISAAAATAAGDGWRSVCAVPRPDDDAMLELAVRLCQRSDDDRL
ncbi:MAG: uroporphyrinogen-III synthase [Sphingomonadaceae bacterium]